MGFFFGMLGAMALWENLAPRRAPTVSRAMRWWNHLGLVFCNSFLSRLLFPTAAVGVAAFGAARGWGIFNEYAVPPWLAVIVSVIVLDLIIYLQHVMVHAIPVLWRVHRVHHADPDMDVTTGIRFHPIEILLSLLIKFAAILILGAPVLAVVIFEILLNAMAMFNHGNVRLPDRLDKLLRRVVVTPDMHRVHHSVEKEEANSNFGFQLSWWDFLFGTYRERPRDGQEGMVIGVSGFRNPREVCRLPGILWLPFRQEQ
uniref:Sterol desaturase/sphingolipid hydroxylase, fatty acid hydroxylase superfamily n=1 Tax=Candidatus Kentrum sp. DK TaxID=2126562 RepID=A0A450SA08_9GAMM|nr:MAG: Sterol desaturase/sphingolipid hydroxylase, fatty acid hydroxylase superfamily [Candidatus Kentron sp. DK]